VTSRRERTDAFDVTRVPADMPITRAGRRTDRSNGCPGKGSSSSITPARYTARLPNRTGWEAEKHLLQRW